MSSWWLCKLDVGKPRDTALVDYLELEFKLRLAIKRTIVCEPQAYLFEGPLLDREKTVSYSETKINIIYTYLRSQYMSPAETLKQLLKSIYQVIRSRLLGSLVVECLHRVREVPGSIPTQGPRHIKNVIKMVPGSSLV